MKLIDLIEYLQDQLADMSAAEQQTAEVRLMTQESYPFENSICGVVAEADIYENEEDEDEEEGDDPLGYSGYRPCDEPDHRVIYITEGRQIGYGTKAAWENC
jgi:hypothetical protein